MDMFLLLFPVESLIYYELETMNYQFCKMNLGDRDKSKIKLFIKEQIG